MSKILKLDPNFEPAFDGPKLASELVQKVTAATKVIAAYLYGSAAEGKNTSNSDLDILLVIPDDSNEKTYYAIVGQPFFSPVAVDWIVKTESEFNKRSALGGVCRIALLNGIQIYKNGEI